MRVVTHLTVIALVAALGTVTLATSAWSAGGALAAVPAAWWSTTQIAQSAVVLACGLGAAGCLWHLISVGIALVVLFEDRSATADAHRGRPDRTTAGGAHALLQRWGAPLVRRVTAGAVIAGLTIAPAAAAQSSVPDDLGWQTTSSGPSLPSAESAPQGTEIPADEVPTDTADGTSAVPDPQTPNSVPRTGETPDAASPTHVVAPGETLWSITEDALGAGATDEQVARAWPRVYEANPEQIGADPSLIHPGATLRLPAAARSSSPPQQPTRPAQS
ncbi:LysM domain-containing protein [uncultured Actinomyces sp.]|uniref:LysM peptidoglycan-binding domain-containing protein n=1 Tax=uncultured Actinomyces sp. TaxID=249061 RepID=UPI0028E1B887|nr:LysM domain-containing protein [uncultured Actinomyces sp.]